MCLDMQLVSYSDMDIGCGVSMVGPSIFTQEGITLSSSKMIDHLLGCNGHLV